MTYLKKALVFKTVDEIGKEDINEIAVDGFFTYDWFKTLEKSQPMDRDPFYVTAYDNRKLVAFAPCFYDKIDQYFLFGPYVIPYMKIVLNSAKKLNLYKNHVLLCYSPHCYRTKISFNTQSEQNSILESLTQEIDTLCKKEKILFSSFLFVSEFDKPLLRHLKKIGYRKFFYKESFYLEVTWRNFEEYLQSLNHKIRNRIRREIKSCKKKGITIQVTTNFKDLSTTMFDLFNNLYSKYRKNVNPPFNPHFYECLSDYAKDKTRVFIARKKGSVVGFCISLQHGDILDIYQCGFNYDLLEKTDFLYFNICYYEPLKYAIQNGVNKMYYRMTAKKVKSRRGCKPEKIYTFIKCYNRFLDSQIGNYLCFRKKLT